MNRTCSTCENEEKKFSDEYPCAKCRDCDLWEMKHELYMNDTVNHPAHYTECSLECIDVMLAVFGRKAVTDFCILNAFKYMWRYEHKNGLEDLQKAERYLAMAGNFQMADKEQENRIINMKAVLEILMRRVSE